MLHQTLNLIAQFFNLLWFIDTEIFVGTPVILPRTITLTTKHLTGSAIGTIIHVATTMRAQPTIVAFDHNIRGDEE
jgi:hypothetical protein